MKKEFKSQLQELLNSSLNARSPIHQCHHKPKSPYDDYSRPSLNTSYKSTSIFGLDYTSPLRSVTKRRDLTNNDSGELFKDLKNRCFQLKERESSSTTTSRNTLFDKQNSNKYTYEELRQLHQFSSKTNKNIPKNDSNNLFNINDNTNKNRFIIKNTPSAIKRKIALFADNFNLNNNSNVSDNSKGKANANAFSLKFDLNKNKTNSNSTNEYSSSNHYNNVQKSKYGSFLNRDLDCGCKDKKRINKWIKEIQSNGNRGSVYVRTEMNNYKGNNNGLERLEFNKDSKNYKFKGDKKMEALQERRREPLFYYNQARFPHFRKRKFYRHTQDRLRR